MMKIMRTMHNIFFIKSFTKIKLCRIYKLNAAKSIFIYKSIAVKKAILFAYKKRNKTIFVYPNA